MKKLLLVGVMAGAAVGVKRCMGQCGRIDFERMIERLPEGSPPKWMFRNISAIRENTERILARLEAEEKPAADEGPADT